MGPHPLLFARTSAADASAADDSRVTSATTTALPAGAAAPSSRRTIRPEIVGAAMEARLKSVPCVNVRAPSVSTGAEPSSGRSISIVCT